MYKDFNVTPQHIAQAGVWDNFFTDETGGHQVFVNSLFGKTPKSFKSSGKYNEDSDQIDLVIGGCSFTEGVGVPDEYAWPELLGKKLKANYINFSRSGKSTGHIVETIISYLRENPKPKYVAILLPYFRRYYAPFNKEIHGTDIIPNVDKQPYQQSFDTPVATPWHDGQPKYLKRPFPSFYVISPEMAIHQWCQSVRILSDYCRLMDIKFVWATWDKDTEIFLDEVEKKFNLSIPDQLKTSCYDKDYQKIGLPEGCHDFEKEIHGDNYYIGSDDKLHSGTHQHIHWALDFYRALTETDK